MPCRVGTTAQPQHLRAKCIAAHGRMMSRVERNGGRTKLRLEQLEPTLDIALRKFSSSPSGGKRQRPVMMGRVEDENQRIGVAIDEIPDLLPKSLAGPHFRVAAADVGNEKAIQSAARTAARALAPVAASASARKVGPARFPPPPTLWWPSARRREAGLEREFAAGPSLPSDGMRSSNSRAAVKSAASASPYAELPEPRGVRRARDSRSALPAEFPLRL